MNIKHLCHRGLPMASLLIVAILSSFSAAQHGDILLAERDGQLAVVGDARVFVGRLDQPYEDDQAQVHHATSNPGFSSLNSSFLPDGYTALPRTSVLEFSLPSFALSGDTSANLWYWDGQDDNSDGGYAGDIEFRPVDGGAAFRVYRGSGANPLMQSGLAKGTDTELSGFPLGQTSVVGGLHVHSHFDVFGPAAEPPASGVYVASLGLEMPGLEDAEPIYLAFRTADIAEAAVTGARTWVANAVVPEPSSLSVLFSLVVTAAAFRRRRS